MAGALLLGFALVAAVTDDGDDRIPGRLEMPDVAGAAACVVAVLLIALRRRWPVPVFVASAGFTVLSVTTPWLVAPAALTCLFCAYTVATRMRRAVSWLSGLVAGVVVYVAGSFTLGAWTQPEAVAIFASAGLAVAVGDLVRTRRAYLAEVLDRAQRAERSRDEVARRRVIEERVRIARELHDVVAHHIAMINVQAGVAAHLLRSRPDQAEESLAHVRQAARTVLDELSTVLGVLRDPEHPGGPADEPARGLAHLPELIEQVTGSGLRVEDRRDGQPRPLSAAMDLAAYRIIQESLTNARKHAPDGQARLCLRFSDDELEITVENSATGRPAGTGYGLAGIRERATALGGRLSAGSTPDGRFVMRARLPVPTPAEATPKDAGSAKAEPKGRRSSEAEPEPRGGGSARTEPGGDGSARTEPGGDGSARTEPGGDGSARTEPRGGGSAEARPRGGGATKVAPREAG
ncbi:two-component sensor histidine kinase [Actinoplanes sp. NBRC 103695]|nr:two-component sensor histidine kinase [Actinoplanes sp. NBRC 103695]